MAVCKEAYGPRRIPEKYARDLTGAVGGRLIASASFARGSRVSRHEMIGWDGQALLDEVLSILRDPRRSEAEKKRLLREAADPSDPRDIAEYEELSEEERERTDQRIFRQVLTDDPDKVEEERDEVERLFRLADSLKHHTEAKFAELLAVLDSSDVIRAEDEKLLIFTEHRETLCLYQPGIGDLCGDPAARLAA